MDQQKSYEYILSSVGNSTIDPISNINIQYLELIIVNIESFLKKLRADPHSLCYTWGCNPTLLLSQVTFINHFYEKKPVIRSYLKINEDINFENMVGIKAK